ncbi:SDR family oxidoreductase [Shewanella marisflavi]|uniref:SDR family oxidoreductase n=1 Tax=Shewanella marisflavi TaxID=260364 RepID=UPI003AAF25F2
MTMTKWALITGGAKRIGKAIAIRLHQSGYNIALHYNSAQRDAQTLAGQLNQQRTGSCKLFQANLASEQEIKTLIEAVNCELTLSVLINNASVFHPDPEIANWQDSQHLLTTNLIAPYLLAQGLAPNLASQSGCIINLVDIHGDRPLKGHGLYSISKAGLNMATRALAQELSPAVRVNGISPGAILWPSGSETDTVTKVINEIPMKRPGTPEDIAYTVDFILNSPYLNGQIIAIDGGRSATGYTGADG